LGFVIAAARGVLRLTPRGTFFEKAHFLSDFLTVAIIRCSGEKWRWCLNYRASISRG
jgi:hypothetical protein